METEETTTTVEQRSETEPRDEFRDESDVVREVDEPSVRSGRWSPAQFISSAIGIFLTVLGGIALSRTGLGELTSPETTVFGFGHTPLLGIIEVGLGVLLMIQAVSAFVSRSMLIALGAVLAAFGLIVLIEPATLNEWLGVSRASGWLYLGLGAGAFILGGLSRVLTRR